MIGEYNPFAGKEFQQEIPNQKLEKSQKVTYEEYEEIESIDIGLKNFIGRVDEPTRVVITLKNGNEISVPWEEAVGKYLPEEFKIVADTAMRARLFERHADALENAIRAGTDVMERSGHIKSTILKMVNKNTQAGGWLENIDKIEKSFDTISTQQFQLLRDMAKKDAKPLENFERTLVEIKKLENEFFELRDTIINSNDTIKKYYQEYARNIPALEL